MEGLLVVRADASPEIGAGHAMRVIALGETWCATGGDCVLVVASLPDWLEREAKQRGVEVRRLPARDTDDDRFASMPVVEDAEWVVVDDYRFTLKHQQRLPAERLVVVDDHNRVGRCEAAWIIDQNVGAEARAQRYREDAPGAGLMLGPRYALLRSEFRDRSSPGVVGPASRVLVTLGGAPPAEARDLRDAVVELLERRGVHVDALTGSDHDVVRRMRDADVVLSAAGTTVWELCALGVPTVLMSIADNQQPVARQVQDAGAAVDLGWYEDLDPTSVADAVSRLLGDDAARSKMSHAARALVDGRGAARVVRALQASRIRLRGATPEDMELVWRWANDPETRAASFTPEPIPWESHVEWFRRRLSDPNCRIYIAEDDLGNPVGQIRFEPTDDPGAVELSISVAGEWRGHGYGVAIVRAGSSRVIEELAVEHVDAVVKVSNEASLRSFRTAGLEELGPEERAGVDALRFRWRM